MSATGVLPGGDDPCVSREQTVPLAVVSGSGGDRKRGRVEARLPGVAHCVKGREVLRVAGPAAGVSEDVVGFGRERPVGGVHGTAAVVGVVREVVGEHVADRDEDAAGDRPAAAVRADETVPEEHFGARPIGDAARAADLTARGGWAVERERAHLDFASDGFEELAGAVQRRRQHRSDLIEDPAVPGGRVGAEGVNLAGHELDESSTGTSNSRVRMTAPTPRKPAR